TPISVFEVVHGLMLVPTCTSQPAAVRIYADGEQIRAVRARPGADQSRWSRHRFDLTVPVVDHVLIRRGCATGQQQGEEVGRCFHIIFTNVAGWQPIPSCPRSEE